MRFEMDRVLIRLLFLFVTNDMNEFADQQFLEYVVKSIVDNPEGVHVDRKVDEMGVLLTLKVDPSNMGQVIGRKGKTAESLRTLLRVVGMKNNARVNLRIDEPEGGRMMRADGEGEAAAGGDLDDLKM